MSNKNLFFNIVHTSHIDRKKERVFLYRIYATLTPMPCILFKNILFLLLSLLIPKGGEGEKG